MPPQAARLKPMRLLVIGDFSAHPPHERPALAARPIRRVDIDNLDDVLARLAPRCAGAHGDVAFTFAFTSLDDFHPDALYARLALFDTLRRARSQPPAAGAELLSGLLGGKPAGAAEGTPARDPIDALVRNIVAPHVVPDTLGQTRSYLAAVDAASAELMRQLLHDPAFQRLEAAWRGVQWLVQNLELDQTLELHLFDAARDEMLADIVAANGRIAQTAMGGVFARGWDAIAVLQRFGPTDTGIGLLAALGLGARAAGAPLLADADPALAGSAPFEALRRSEAGPFIGLAAPRLLLRQPYGRRSDPVDAFAFEEFAGAPEHEALLWGNAALAPLLLLGRGGNSQQIDGLPAYTFERDGESVLQPCAERLLSEHERDTMIGAGLMPLASHRDRNAVTLPRLQSIATPATELGVPR